MGFMMVAVDPGIETLFACYPGERLTPEQVGEAIGQSTQTVRRQLRDGDLPGYRIGTGTKTSWMCVKSEVIAVLRSRWNQHPQPHQHSNPTPDPTTPDPQLVATSTNPRTSSTSSTDRPNSKE